MWPAALRKLTAARLYHHQNGAFSVAAARRLHRNAEARLQVVGVGGLLQRLMLMVARCEPACAVCVRVDSETVS